MKCKSKRAMENIPEKLTLNVSIQTYAHTNSGLKSCKENSSGGRHLVLYWNVEFSDFHNAIDTRKIYDKNSELIVMNICLS